MAPRMMTRSLLLLPITAFALTANADLVVLQYHHVSDSTPSSTSTSVSLFQGQLDMIEDLGLEVVPLESGTRAALAGELNDRSQVAITFDDAYESVYSQAAPALQERGYEYTIFVNTEAVGSHGYMTWDQLQEVRDRDGVTIANHSKDHGHLAKRPGESDNDWEARVNRSLDEAQETLSEKLGTNVPMFAYPYGEFDDALLRKIRHVAGSALDSNPAPSGRLPPPHVCLDSRWRTPTDNSTALKTNYVARRCQSMPTSCRTALSLRTRPPSLLPYRTPSASTG
jgi:peptidoglycan/xylan/chitin deacetylase (PgdA/CDA1 family)